MPARLEVKVGQEDQKGVGRRLEQKERDRRCSGDGRKVLFSDFLYVRYGHMGKKHISLCVSGLKLAEIV